MIRAQREAARADLGTYQGSPPDLPRLNVDQAVALFWYWERSYGKADNWETTVADQFIVALVRPGPDGRPTRSMTDTLDVDEALRVWTALAVRADQLDPMCAVVSTPSMPPVGVPPMNIPMGFCPKDFKYDSGSSAQLRRVSVRVALAVQRVLKVIKPPPLLNPIGELLRALGWLALIAIVAAEGEPRWKKKGT